MTEFELKMLEAYCPSNLIDAGGLEMANILKKNYKQIVTEFKYLPKFWQGTGNLKLDLAIRIMVKNPEKFINWNNQSMEFLREQFKLFGEQLHGFGMKNPNERKERWEQLAENIRDGGKVPGEFADKVYNFASAVNPMDLGNKKLKNLLDMPANVKVEFLKENGIFGIRSIVAKQYNLDSENTYCVSGEINIAESSSKENKLTIKTNGVVEVEDSYLSNVNLINRSLTDNDLEMIDANLNYMTKEAQKVSNKVYEK